MENLVRFLTPKLRNKLPMVVTESVSQAVLQCLHELNFIGPMNRHAHRFSDNPAFRSLCFRISKNVAIHSVQSAKPLPSSLLLSRTQRRPRHPENNHSTQVLCWRRLQLMEEHQQWLSGHTPPNPSQALAKKKNTERRRNHDTDVTNLSFTCPVDELETTDSSCFANPKDPSEYANRWPSLTHLQR